MSQAPNLIVAVAPDLPADQRDALIGLLQHYGDVRDEPYRSVDPATVRAAWDTFVAVMGDMQTVGAGVTATAGAGVAVIAFVERLQAWRRNLRAQGVTPQARFEGGDQAPLDLQSADDAELQRWFLEFFDQQQPSA